MTEGKCPLKKGDIVTNHIIIPVQSPFGGGIPANIEASLTNEKGHVIACVELPVKIWNP